MNSCPHPPGPPTSDSLHSFIDIYLHSLAPRGCSDSLGSPEQVTIASLRKPKRQGPQNWLPAQWGPSLPPLPLTHIYSRNFPLPGKDREEWTASLQDGKGGRVGTVPKGVTAVLVMGPVPQKSGLGPGMESAMLSKDHQPTLVGEPCLFFFRSRCHWPPGLPSG